MFGHQKCRAARVILLVAGCLLCRRLITVVPRFFGTIILSSMKTRPNRLDNFLLYIWYLSGIILCSLFHILDTLYVHPTYRAQFIAGTSRIEGSWSVSESISPSSTAIGADDGPGLSDWCCRTAVGRSIPQNGSTVHCSE